MTNDQNTSIDSGLHRTAHVEITEGVLEGSFENNVFVFRGVPFAKPPVGPLRFRSPVKNEPWPGIRSAKENGPASYQVNSGNKAKVMTAVRESDPGVMGIMAWPAYVEETYHQAVVSEDCLYLSIWSPDIKPEKKLPVYVYYHGGANAVSAGSFDLENGANMAVNGNMIVVRPNYRLGALGWVHFGLISDLYPEAVNLGFQDQIASLKWVYDHIESFGGDKENITVGGESAGATCVSHLLTHPEACKYIKRAVIQSLSPFNPWCTQQEKEAVVVARKYLEMLNVTDPKELMDTDPDDFLSVQSIMTRLFSADLTVAWRPLGGVVDGNLIPEAPALYLSESSFPKKDIEIVIGMAKDEWQFFRGHSDTIRHGAKNDVLKVLSQLFGEKRNENVYDAYRKLYPEHTRPGHILSDIMSFAFFKYSSLSIARNLSAQGIPVYVFEFAYDLPGLNGELRAVHTGDIPFLFQNYTRSELAMWPAFEGADVQEISRVADEMGRFYADFIAHGNPGGNWKPFDTDEGNILWFGKEVKPVPGLLQSEWKIFTDAGIKGVRSIENTLVMNVKQALLYSNQIII